MDSHQLINQTTGNQEWGTPPLIIEAARKTMGSIDLDPASCAEANAIVKADSYLGKVTDGLICTWWGNVWLNWPFGRKENYLWVSKLMREWSTGHIRQALTICFAATSEGWFEPLKSYPQCSLNGRTNYIDLATGLVVKGVSKGSVVTYLGHNLDAFVYNFTPLGEIQWPTRYVDKRFFRGLHG